MTTTPSQLDASAPNTTHKRKLNTWPLWASAAGAFGFAGTVIFDVRPPAELEAFENGTLHVVTPADMETLDVLTGRLGWMAGLFAVAALLIFSGIWHTRVARPTRSSAATVVTFGLVATAAAGTLGYGWKGALANYLGAESGMYDANGQFVYYMLTDFGAYFPWVATLIASFAVVWMAFGERTVSRVLGAVSAIFAIGLTALMFAMGVPGIPATLIPVWLIIFGIWLAVGRSKIMLPGERRA